MSKVEIAGRYQHRIGVCAEIYFDLILNASHSIPEKVY